MLKWILIEVKVGQAENREGPFKQRHGHWKQNDEMGDYKQLLKLGQKRRLRIDPNKYSMNFEFHLQSLSRGCF